jgi:beta-mannosidase
VAISVTRTCRDWSQTYMNPMLDVGHVDPTLDAKEGTKYVVWVVSDEDSLCLLQVEIRFISIRTGSEVKAPITLKNIQVAPNATTEVSVDTIPPLSPELADASKPFDWDKYDPYIIYVSAHRDGRQISKDAAWPQPFKYLDFSSRGLSFETPTDAPNQVSIKTEKPVKGLVFEETRGMKLSENNFDLIPGEEIVMDFKGVSLPDLRYTYVGASEASMKI